jgi:hypothetical protein
MIWFTNVRSSLRSGASGSGLGFPGMDTREGCEKPGKHKGHFSPTRRLRCLSKSLIRSRFLQLLPRPVGRGEGWGEGDSCNGNGPPLPSPLLLGGGEGVRHRFRGAMGARREKAPTKSKCAAAFGGLTHAREESSARTFRKVVSVFDCFPVVTR